MALRDIVREPDEVLNKVCRKVDTITKRTLELLDDMAETMYDAKGVGLAAPQVGVLRRIVVIDVGEGLIELINPEITYSEGEQVDEEACLSCGSRRAVVARPKRVAVVALDRNGKEVKILAEDFFARALCHEIDHLDGYLILDRMIRELYDEEEYEEGEY